MTTFSRSIDAVVEKETEESGERGEKYGMCDLSPQSIFHRLTLTGSSVVHSVNRTRKRDCRRPGRATETLIRNNKKYTKPAKIDGTSNARKGCDTRVVLAIPITASVFNLPVMVTLFVWVKFKGRPNRSGSAA